jgi:hypothetical protein
MVVGVLGILAITVVPQIGNLLSVMQARGAVEQVTSALRLGRQYAVATSATYAVTFTETTVAIACSGGCPPSPPQHDPQPITHDATVDAGTCTLPCTVAFDSRGGAGTAAGVRLSRPGVAAQHVCVSPGGRIYAKPPGVVCP